MCNSTDPAAPAAASRPVCPPWCDAQFCEVTPGDVIHRSAPVYLDTIDARYVVRLVRFDELAFPGEWGGLPYLRLGVESHSEAVPGSNGDVPLGLDVGLEVFEVLPLLGALAAQLALAGGAS